MNHSSLFMHWMRRHAKLPVTAVLIALFPMWTAQVKGATFYWDSDVTAAGNNSNGSGLGGTGTWDTTTANWWNLSTDVLWPNATSPYDSAIFTGAAGTVTLGTGINVGSLSFKTDGYNVTGGTLTLGGPATINVSTLTRATIGSTLAGTSGLTKTGNGTLVLTNSGNSFSGDVSIQQGQLVITDAAQLGVGTKAISITGVAQTGSPGFSGGALVLQGAAKPAATSASAAGITLTREVTLAGRGPGVVNNSGGLVSIGYNTLAGGLTLGSAVSENRAWAAYGSTTISGGLYLGVTGQNSLLQGNGNWIISGVVTGAENLGDRFIKTGQLIGTTLWLQNAANNFTDALRVDSGTVRVQVNSALGQNRGTGQIDLNNGVLEIRTDAAAGFAGRNARVRNNTTGTFFVDHNLTGGLGIGSSLLNQTVTMGSLIRDTGVNVANFTVNGRNGYNTTFTSATPAAGDYRGITVTNNSSGTVTLTGGDVWNANNATASTYTIGGNGDTVITGSILAVTADNTVTKSGTGYFTYGGAAGTYLGSTNITGTMAITTMGALNAATVLPIQLNSGALDYRGLGETSGKMLNLSGTTGNGIILANQSSGTALVFNNSYVAGGGVGSKTLYLGGSSSAGVINEIAGLIVSSVGNTTSLAKVGSNTWLYDPAASAAPQAGGSAAWASGGAVASDTFVISGATGTIAVGQSVTGTSIPAGSVVTAVNGTTITISNLIGTALTTGTITFGAIAGFTGSVTVSGGVLQARPTANSGNGSDLIGSASQIIFAADALRGNQWAGGTFEYQGSAAGGTLTEQVGALTLTAGAGAVKVTANGGTPTLNFASLGTRTAGATLNLNPGAGTSITFTAAAGANGLLGGYATFGAAGTEFAASVTAGGAASALTGQSELPTSGSTSTVNYKSTGTPGANLAAESINSLKIVNTQTITLGGILTVTSGGILFDNSNGAATIQNNGTAGNTLGASATEVIITTNGSAPGNLLNNDVGSALTISALISASTGSLTKAGSGVLILSGANAYTGTTTINEGGIKLSGSGTLGGTSASLTMRQGTVLDLNGISIGTITANGLNAFNGAGTITNSAASGTAVLRVGNANTGGLFSGLIKDGDNAAIAFSKAGSGTLALTSVNTFTGGVSILGGTLAVTSLADGGLPSSIGSSSNSAANLVFNGGILQYTGSNATIYQTTQTPSVSIDRLFTLAGNGTIDSSGQFGNSVLATGNANSASLIFRNQGDIVFSGTATARTLTLQGSSIGDNELDVRLIDNGAGALSFTKAGTGLWILNPLTSNVYTGTTTVSGGALRVASSANTVQGLSSSSPLVLNGGVLETSGTFTRTLGAAVAGIGTTVAITGGASGFSAATPDRLVVTIGGGALTWGTTNFNPSSLVLGSSTALGEAEITNDIAIGAATRTITVNNNGNTGTMVTAGILSGVISGAGTGGNSIIKNGGGVLILGNSNTYTGSTRVDGGNLIVTSIGTGVSSSLGASGALIYNGPGNADLNALNYVGAGEIANRDLTFQGSNFTGNRVYRIDSSGSGALIWNTGTFANTTRGDTVARVTTLEFRGSSTDNNQFNMVLANSTNATFANTLAISKNDGGVWTLNPASANSFTGTITVAGGLLGLTANGIGTSSGLVLSNGGIFAYGGALSVAMPVTQSNNTAVVFAGSNDITLNGSFTVAAGNNAQTISNNLDSGALLTVNGAFINQKANDQTINIRGTGSTVWNGVIANASANLTTWDIRLDDNAYFKFDGSSANTYTGATLLGQGTLILSKNSGVAQFGASSQFNFNGGVLTADLALTGADKITTKVSLQGDQATINGTNSIDLGGIVENNGGNRFLRNELTGAATLTLSGTVNLSNDGTGRTLTLRGAGSTTISGVVANGGAGAGGLAYSGLSTLSLTNANTATGALTVNRNTVTLSGSGAWAGSLVLNPIGTITLDNTAGSVNRLADAGAVTGQGGTLNIIGAAGGTTETTGALTLNSVQTYITTSGGNVGLTFASVSFANSGSSLNLGGISSLGVNNTIKFTAAPSGATVVFNGVIPRIFLGGTDFAKYDPTNGVVALVAADYNLGNNLNTAAATDTLDLTASSSITTNRTINAIKIDGTGLSVGGSAGARLTVTSGGIINTAGNNSLDATSVSFTNTPVIQVQAGTTLTVNSTLISTGNFVKALPGTLAFTTPSFMSGTHNLLNGTTKLISGGLNTFFPGNLLNINDGATLDLNGGVQYMGQLSDPGVLPEAGGLITSSSGTGTIVTNMAVGSTTFATNINGSVNLARVGTNTLTLESVNTYSGFTVLMGGTLQLQDDATILNTSSIDLNGAQLTLNNNSSLQRAVYDRVGDTTPITLRDGTLAFTGKVSDPSYEVFGALTSAQGANAVTVTSGGTGTSGAVVSADVTFASLTRNLGTTVNFSGTTLGQQGNSSQIFFTTPITTNANGAIGAWAFANSTDYAAYNTGTGVGVVGQGGYTGYSGTFATGEITEIPASAANTTLLAPGTTTTGMLKISGAFNNDIAFTNSGDILNLEQGGLLRSNNSNASSIGTTAVRGVLTAGGTETSGLRELIEYSNATGTANFTGGATTVGSATITMSSTVGLSPGMTVTNAGLPAGTYIVSIVDGTTVIVSQNATATASAQTFVGGAANVIINSVIADNGAGNSVQFIKSGAGILNLSANNTYTGGTIIDQGTVNLIGSGVVIPAGGLILGGANLTLNTNAGQIDPSNVVTIRRSSVLTLVGNNTLNRLIFDNNGGIANPTVTVGAGNTLTLTSSTPVTVNNSNAATVPTISAGTLALAAGVNTFSVEGPTVNGLLYTNISPSLNISSVISGYGSSITKTGSGVMQLSGQNTFNGLTISNGGILISGNSNSTSGGTGLTSGPLGVGSVSAAAGTVLLVDGSRSIGNDIAFAGTPTFDSTANTAWTLSLNGSLTGAGMGATPTIQINNPFLTVALLGNLGTLTSISKTGPGILIFNASNYSGDFNATALGNPSSVSLLADGDGTGSVQSLLTTNNVIFDAGIVPTIVVGRAGGSLLYNLAANKIIAPASVSSIAGGLNVTNNNGYGLQVSDAVAFSGTPTISVSTATASNVTQGLYLSGNLSGTGFNKTGAGTLVINNATPANNTFTGNINITQGVVSVGVNGQLGNAANMVVLAPSTGTSAFRATGTFSTSQVIQLANTANTRAIEVSSGNTLTLSSAFDLNGGAGATAALNKQDLGTLVVNASNTGWSGQINITEGAILVNNPALTNPLGTGTIVASPAAVVGSALQLAGGVTINNPLTLQAAANLLNGGINFQGTLDNVSGTNTYAGGIAMPFDATIGARAGSTLNITGLITATGTHRLQFNAEGDINLTGGETGALFGFDKYGQGTLTISTALFGGTITTGGVKVEAGTLKLSGAGTINSNGAVALVYNGATMWLDNSGTNTSNRLNGKALTLQGGTFNFTANSSTETAGALVSDQGSNVINIGGTGTAALTFASLTSNVGSTLDVTGTFGTATNFLKFTTAPALTPVTTGILNRVTVNGNELASYSASLGVVAFTGYSPATNILSATATQTFKATTSTLNSLTGNQTLNALTINNTAAVGGLGGNPPATLTLTSGTILANGSGGAFLNSPVVAFGAAEAIIHVQSGQSLTINSGMSGTAGLSKDLPGELDLNAQQFITGTTYINEGTVKLTAPISSNVMFFNQALAVNYGGTLDLNGHNQFVAGLSSATAGGGNGIAGGTVKNSGGAQSTFTINGNTNFAGVITDNIYLNKTGTGALNLQNAQTYTGPTLLTGGTTTLNDYGALSNTSAIDINYATLSLANGNLYDVADRVKDTAPITLRGGTISYTGRAQYNSTETIGAVTLVEGLTNIFAATGGTNVNSATLTIDSITRSVGSSATLRFNSLGAIGTIGSVASIRISGTAPTLTNNIIGAWAIVDREYASYDPTYGIGGLNSTGFAGYAGSGLNSNPLATDNVRLSTAGTTLLTGNTTVGTLTFASMTTATILDLGGNTLTLQSGGLLLAQATDSVDFAITNGSLTSGIVNVASDLYITHANFAGTNRTNTLNASVVNNGSGAVRLIFTSGQIEAAGVGNTTINAVNTNTGGTIINSGNIIIGATGALGTGGVTVNQGILTQTVGGVIPSSNVLTLGGGSVVTLANQANTLAGITFNNLGGAAPTLNPTGVLTLTGGIAVTTVNAGGVASIANGTLDLNANGSYAVNVGATVINGVNVAPWQASLNITSLIQNGGITKSGDGLLQLSSTLSTFAGGVNVTTGGLIIGASSLGSNLGDTLTSGPLGTGTVTMAANTTLLSSGAFSVTNDFTFLGDTVFNGINNLTLNGNTTLPSTWNVTVTAPQMTVTIGNVINSLSTDVTNKAGLGTLILGNYNGTINIAGGLIFLADGNTLGTVESVNLSGNVALTADTAITVNRSGAGPFARNKTLQKVNLTNNGSILAVNNVSGYGLEFTGTTTLTGASHFSVVNATASNLVQGLTLSGVVSDTGGFSMVKSGLGTLFLTNSGNTFGGVGATIDVLNGVLAVTSDGALGNAANTITLEVDGLTGTGFRAAGTFSTSRLFLLNALNNAFEVTQGNTFTLTTPFSLSAVSNTLNKNDNGVLAINANNSSMTGAVNINAGAILVLNSNAIGSGTITISNAIGSALQLSGGVTLSNPITLTTNSQNSGINSAGSIQSVSGVNTYTGLITQTAGNAATFGADAGATLNINGGIATANTSSFYTGAGGVINLNSVLGNGGAGGALTKIGSGTLNVTVNQPSYTGAVTINAGTLSISGNGVKLGTAGLITVTPTGTLAIDDTGTATASRLSGRALTLTGGSFSYLGNSGTSTESIGALTISRPGVTITSNSNGGSTTITFASLASNIVTADGSVNFIGLGAALGSATNKILFTAAPTLTNNIIQRATVGGADFATYGANGIAAFTAYNAGSTTNINSVTATSIADINAAMTTRNLTATRTLNALRFSDSAGANVGATGAAFIAGGATPAQLVLSAGAILATGGGSNTLSVPVLNNAAVQNFYAVDTSTSLNITSAIVGTAGWVKSGAGTLIFTPPSSPIAGRGASTITGNASIEGGTVILNGGNNTLAANQNLLVGPGATLDLNGNSQFVQILFTDTGAVEGAGGTITGGVLSSSTLVTNQDNTARNWAGVLTGDMSFLRSGQNTLTMYSNNDYTGLTSISGGTTTLKDGGRLSGTTDIQIVYATLNIDNTGSKDLTDRINDAASITLRGGTLAFLGRAQTASTETVGAVTLARGASFISSTAGGTGINSADLTLTSLTRTAGSGTVNFTAATGGQAGSSARILIPTINGVSTSTVGGGLTNDIIGGWAIIGTSDFATYIPGLGVVALGANGAPAYSNTTSTPNTLNIAGATDNISINAAVTGNLLTLLNNTTLNSLRIGNIAAQTVDIAAGKTLTLTSGGLLFFSTASQTIGSSLNKGSITTTGPELFIYTQGTGPQIINSSITGSGVMLVKSGSGQLNINGTNTYDGGTTINQGAVVLGLSSGIPLAANPANGLILSGATFTATAAGQIAAGNIVTLNGSSTLNLVGSNTLGGLIFRDDGGGTTASQVVSNQNGGVLTLNGNIVSTTANPASTSTIVGRIDFGSTNRTLDISATRFNGQELAALLADFILQGVTGSSGGITKVGDGVLQLNGQDVYSGATTVSNGRLQIGVTNGGSRFSDVTLQNGTALNLNGFSTILGSLAGSGYVMNSSASTTAQTLTVGFSGASTTFSGAFLRFNDATPATLNLAKIGSGTLTFDTDGALSTLTTNSLTVNRGTVSFKDNGTSSFPFAALVVNEGGTLTLDNTGTANNDARLRNGAVTLNGGVLNYLGAASTASAETSTGVLTFGPSATSISLTAGAGGTAFLRFASLAQSAGSTAIVSGGNLGTDTRLLFTTAPTLTNNILPRIAVGTDFATYNSTNGIVAFAAYTSLTDINTGVTANTVKIESTTTTRNITLARTVNALNIIDNNVTLGSSGLLLPTQGLTLSSGGVLVNGNSATISTPVLALSVEGIFRVNGDSLNITSSITGTAGITKTGSGSMTLSSPQSYTGLTALNLGSLTLAGGNNTLLVVPSATIPTVADLQVNGGVFDLNGNNQAVRTLLDSNTLAFVAGEITNSSLTAATLTTAMNASSTFGGKISGNLSLVRSGNNTLTLVDAQTYTGATVIRGGGLTLQDLASLSTSSITLNFGALTLSNANLNALASLNPVRFAASTPVTLQGGTVVFTPGGSVDNTTAINTLTILAGGANTLTPNGVAGGTNTITIGNLILPVGTGTTLHFSTDPGQPTTSGAQVFLTQINGAAPANNSFLGANVIINNGEYGVYNTIQGVIRYGGTALTGNTVPAYSAALASGNNLPTNISSTGADVAISANTTIGALRLTGAATRAITFTLGSEVLNLALGGLLRDNNNNATNIGTTALRGVLTSGGTATTGITELVEWHNQSTVTINSIIADNGLGNLTRFVKSGAAGTTLTAANTYTGGTVVDQGTLTINATAGAGTVVIPAGGVTLNNASLTMSTSQGQIDASNTITINGVGTLTLVGTNTLNSVMFNSIGGNATPTVAVGTLLALSSATPITVTNDNYSFTPTISGTELNLVDGASISTAGQSADDLIISAKISTVAATTPLVKTGAGSLVLSSTTSAFANGFNLNQGTLIFAAASTGTPPSVTAGPVGTGTLTLANGVAVMSDGTARIIGNAVSVTQDFTFGTLDATNARANAGNNLTFSGIVTLAAGAHHITVNGLLMTGTISGKLTGGTNLFKDGVGTLVLSSAANDFGGFITINAGVLQLGAAGVIPDVSALTIAAAGFFDINGKAETIGSLAGAGVATNTGAAAALTIGSDNTDTVFTGTLTNQANALNLVKTGTGRQTLSGANSYTGTTAVNSGMLSIGSSTGLGTTAGGTTVAAGASLELQGNITVGAEALSIAGTGTATNGALRNLSGANSYGGTVTLTADATIQSDAGSLTLNAANAVTGTARNLTVTGSGDTVISGTITTTTGTLSKSGTGTLTLSGANTFTGTTTVNDGVVNLNTTGVNSLAGNLVVAGGVTNLQQSNQIADTKTVTVSGGEFALGTSSETVAGVQLAAGTISGSTGVLTSTTNYDMQAGSASAILGGGVGLDKTTSGTVTLSGVNTYTGQTTVSGGILRISTEANLGTTPVAPAPAQLTLNGGTLQTTADVTLAENRGVTVGGTGSTLDTATGTTTTVSGVITGSGTLTKEGTGALIFTAANTNTGATNVNAGTLGGTGVGGNLTVNSSGTLAPGVAGTGLLTVGGNLTLNSGSTLVVQLGGVTLNDEASVRGNENSLASLSPSTISGWESTNTLSLHDRIFSNDASAPVINGTIKIDSVFLNGYTPVFGDVFDLMDWTTLANSITGTPTFDFSGINLGGLAFNTDLFSSNGIIVVVPEPGRFLLLLFGLVALMSRRRRSSRS